MIKKKTITTKKDIDDEIICDCCGKSCLVAEYEINNPVHPDYGHMERIFEFMELKAVWGYHSGKDGEKWIAQVCESCVTTKLSVIINFQKTEYI